MKMRDFGKLGQAKLDQWLQQIFQFSENKVSFFDNMDCIFQNVYIGSGGSQIEHNLGRVPQGVIEVATQQTGTAGISPTLGKAWTNQHIYLTRTTSGNCQVMIF
jgi:hypothetical protein